VCADWWLAAATLLDTVQSGIIFHLVNLGLGASQVGVPISQLQQLGNVSDVRLRQFSDPRIRAWASAPCILMALLAFTQGSRARVNSRSTGETTSDSQQEGFASQIIYIFVILASKLSVLFLYLRLSPGGSHRIASWSLVALSCVWALVSVILIAIPCNPAQTYVDADCTNRVCRF
jgi:hypothetical protein